jgi:hypothetical protein
LEKVARLAEKKLELTRELNRPSGSTGTAANGVGLTEVSDKQELKTFSKMQQREIEALRNEITALRRKDAPLLLSSTVPNPPSNLRTNSAKFSNNQSSLPPIRPNVSR